MNKNWEINDTEIEALYTEVYHLDSKKGPEHTEVNEPSAFQETICIGLREGSSSKLNLDFLSKVMSAVAVNLSDCSVQELHDNCPINDITSSHPNANKIFLFGSHSENQLNRYTVINHEDKHILAAHDLGKIQKDTNLKKQLWTQLKSLFD